VNFVSHAPQLGNIALLVAIVGTVVACRPPAPPPPRPTEAEVAAREANNQRNANRTSGDSKHAKRKDGLTGGVLLFTDNFSNDGLGDDWDVKLPGEWTVTNGELVASKVKVYDDRNKGVWLNVPLPEKVRVEFESRSMGKDGDSKCEIFATEQKHEAGYSVIFGGWSNTINAICRMGEHEPRRVVQTPHLKVKAGKRYKWTIVRTDAVVRWYIDGKFIIAYDDPKPVRGKWFAFNNWLSDVRFDNVKVWRL
jgi:hypothetical protein